MSATAEPTTAPQLPEVITNEVRAERTTQRWVDWFLTVDHKQVGVLYIVSAIVFFFLGGTEALMMRLQLGVANNSLITPDAYNQLFTMHGTTMLFLFLAPVIAGLASYLVPLMIGARTVAFPRLNALSYWLFLAGGITLYATLFFTPPSAGWTSYPPLSGAVYSPSNGQDAWIFLFILTGVASIISAITMVATIISMRAPGLEWGRLPVFCWTVFAHSLLIIVALPVAIGASVMLFTDRHFGTAFFDPTAGGSPLLWQQLFWFYGQPQLYVLLLPVFGVISEILPVFTGRKLFGYKAVVRSVFAIAALSLVTWGSHLFTAPGSSVVNSIFMIGSLLIAVPIAVLVLNWLATLSGASAKLASPFLYAIGCVALFVSGAIAGLLLAIFPVAWQLDDSYFQVAQFHDVVVGGGVFGVLAALHYWFPKISGRMVNENIAKASFGLVFASFVITFLVQYSLGLDGMPRRIYEYGTSTGWQTENMISTVGSFLLGIGLILVAANFVRSLSVGAKAGPDPWGGNTLEWFSPSPPPANNFDVIPAVGSAEPMRDIRAAIAGGANSQG